MAGVLEASGWDLVARKAKAGLERWDFQPHSLTSEEGTAAGCGLSQSPMTNELVHCA